MPRGRAHLTALLLLACGTPCWALPEDAPPRWWTTPAAREEAGRVLEQVGELIRTSEQGDARPAVAALRDAAWVVRRLAAVRLELLGLPGEVAAALRSRGRPGAEAPPADWPPLRQAEAFALTREAEPLAVDAVGRGEAARVVAHLTATALREAGEAPAAARRRALEALLALRPALPDAEDRGALAEAVLGLLGADERRELAAGGREATARGGRAVFRWVEENAAYLAWRPRARAFIVDREARAARQPTDAYRARRPWPEEQ